MSSSSDASSTPTPSIIASENEDDDDDDEPDYETIIDENIVENHKNRINCSEDYTIDEKKDENNMDQC